MLNDILGFLAKAPSGLWDLLPTLGAPGWAGEGVRVLIGLGSLTAITRFVPDKWAYQPIVTFLDKLGVICAVPFFVVFKAISETCTRILGRRRWEKIEEQVVEKAIGNIFKGIHDGVLLFLQRIRNGAYNGLNVDDD